MFELVAVGGQINRSAKLPLLPHFSPSITLLFLKVCYCFAVLSMSCHYVWPRFYLLHLKCCLLLGLTLSLVISYKRFVESMTITYRESDLFPSWHAAILHNNIRINVHNPHKFNYIHTEKKNQHFNQYEYKTIIFYLTYFLPAVFELFIWILNILYLPT